MKTILLILSCLFLLGFSPGALSQDRSNGSACQNDCITVHQFCGDENHASIPLICGQKRGACLGKGTLRIFGEEVPVVIEAKFQPGQLVFRIKNERIPMGGAGQDYFHMPLGPGPSRQTMEFELYSLPDWGVFRSGEKKVTPLVLRFGERIPGILRVIVERIQD